MIDEQLAKQYNDRTKLFEELEWKYNGPSREPYYDMWNFNLMDKKVLDVGCGFGTDLNRASDLGATSCHGIDASEEFIEMAKQNVFCANLRVGFMEEVPYPDETFDVVMSRYVIQTSKDVPKCLDEMVRVLKEGGSLIYLTVDPMRTFVEKNEERDYFKQEVMKSSFFGGNFSTMEPTHTYEEYFNESFLKKCHITGFRQYTDFNSAIRVEKQNYPCFMIVRARKFANDFIYSGKGIGIKNFIP
jgi:ubiquinone/menaquinone biosynthesis C-methylase UbiE